MPTPIDHNSPAPPPLAEKLLSMSLPAELREQMLGDLHEEYQQYQLPERGVIAARGWYYWQTIQSIYVYLNKQKEGVMGFIISTLLFLALVIAAMVLGSSIKDYIDFISIVIVIPPSIAFGIAATSWRHFKLGILLVISDQTDIDPALAIGAKQCMKIIGNVAMLMGALMTLIGWGAMAANIDSDEFDKVFGPALAVSILTLLYATVMKIICYTAEEKIQFRYLSDKSQ